MKEKLIELIQTSVQDYAEQSQNNLLKNPGPDTKLFGQGASLDSIGLVSVVVDIEQRVDEEFDVAITLADEKAMSQRNSPFQSVTRLAEYIAELMEEENE